MIHATDIAGKTKEEVLLTRKQRRLLATLLHQAEKKARRLDKHASTSGAYEFVADDGHLTGYAGMFLIKDLAQRMKVLRLFRDMVTIKKRDCTYQADLLSYLLVEQKIMGIPIVEAAEVLRTDDPYHSPAQPACQSASKNAD
ncbi:hypothetical protein JW905_17140 [bacterium]|nr:hypothetical protein [candidate division CSSED10-310 bacterium]